MAASIRTINVFRVLLNRVYYKRCALCVPLIDCGAGEQLDYTTFGDGVFSNLGVVAAFSHSTVLQDRVGLICMPG